MWKYEGARNGARLLGRALIALLLISGTAAAADTGTTADNKQTGLGSLSVFISPPAAVGSAAKWQVDGGAFQDSEAILNGLSVGQHTVCFLSVPYYNKPACFEVTIRENETTFATGAYIPQVGGVTVAIQPPEVVAAGAQWSVDGSDFQDSGATVTGLFVGSPHGVVFKPVPGWITPLPITDFRVPADEVEPFIRTYVPESGTVAVGISPTAALSAGAQWQIDGGMFRLPGSLGGVAAGTHTISFKTIPGFATPVSRTITVRSNQVTTVAGIYEQQTGGISVTLSPAEAVAAGAQWRIDNGSFLNTGALQNGVTAGTHTLSFSTAPGFIKPADRRVIILPNQTIFETGEYIEESGGLNVVILPEEAVDAGAQWQVDGGDLRNSEVTINGLSLGSHELCFTDVAGFRKPDCFTVEIEAGETTFAVGEYQPPSGNLTVNIAPDAAVTAGAKWRVDGGPFQFSNAIVEDLTVGTHTVTFNTIDGFYSPAEQTVTIAENQTTATSAVYTPQTGALSVTLGPVDAVDKGAQWRVDGGSFKNSGATVSGLSLGTHTVSFKEITGYATPGNKTVNILAEQTTTTSATYSKQTGGLTVYLEPTSVIAAGGQWQVDDRALQASGTVAEGLSVGAHILYFREVPGYVAPSNMTVNVTANEVVSITGNYQPETGNLTVTLTPPSAVEAGAQWQVDGGPMRNSGATVSGLAFGAHTLSFREVPGFATPRDQTISIEANQTTNATGDYTPQKGGLRVTLSPASAVAAGAQWQVDGGDFQNSGATVNGLTYGLHTVAFKAVSGFPTPANKAVFVNGDLVTNATGDYSTQTGGLKVNLSPAAAVSAGAQWKLDDGPFQNSGTTVNRLSVGSHTLFFKTISGFPTPEPKPVTVVASEVSIIAVAYASETGGLTVTLSPPAAVSAGAQWKVDDGAPQNSGATVNDLTEGAHTLSFTAVPGFITPENQNVTITLGEVEAATGAYTQETGSLTVSISPDAAIAAGARWKLDNGVEQQSGATLSGVTAGSHTLSFTAVSGFATPSEQTVTVQANQTATASGIYSENAACCAGSAPVKSLKEAVDFYLGDVSLLFGAMVALVLMSRLRRSGM